MSRVIKFPIILLNTQIQKFRDDIVRASYVCMDGNISLEAMEYVLNICSSHNVPGMFQYSHATCKDNHSFSIIHLV